MSERDRYGRVADAFTRVVESVPDDAWERPAPCEGWVARDVVRHLVEWVPAFFFGTWELEAPTIPSVDDDPVGAWRALDGALRAALGDPEVAGRLRETPFGSQSLEETLGRIVTGDVLVHTWDLARATGGDERLDRDEVHRMYEAMAPMEEAMRGSGHFGPRVEVPADADEQTRLLAFTGRRP